MSARIWRRRVASAGSFFNGFRKDSRRGFQGDKGDAGTARQGTDVTASTENHTNAPRRTSWPTRLTTCL